MKTLTNILFVVIGAIASLLAIFLGDLRVFEQFIIAIMASAGITALGVMVYNFVKSAPAEKQGNFTTPAFPIVQPMLYAIGGAVVTVALFALL